MSDLVLDASLTLQWFLEDEADRQYALNVLVSLSRKRAAVPVLWFYEVGNGLLMAHRRNRVSFDQVQGFLTRLRDLPIQLVQQAPTEMLELPTIAQKHRLTNYDAAYLDLAMRLNLPLATNDADLRRAAADVSIEVLA